MLSYVGFFQFSIFLIFFTLERLLPARKHERASFFYSWNMAVNAFAIVWFSGVLLLWGNLPDGVVNTELGVFGNALVFYLIWSFCGYWWHRVRHANRFLWNKIHKFHHSPPAMEAAVAFFKHPFEYGSNSILITLIAWFFGFPAEAIIIGLTIEGTLEVFHHSNIKLPRWLRFIGYVIQTPDMHLVHHERGLHRYNYATCIWDTVFGTVYIPDRWEGKQGFASGYDIKGHFLLKN